MLYFTHLRGMFTLPHSTKLGAVRVTDVINYIKFGNDRSRQNKLTDGRTLPCSTEMTRRL